MTRTAKKGRKRHLEASQWEDLCRDGGDGCIKITQSVEPESVAEDGVQTTRITESKKIKHEQAKLEKETKVREDDGFCKIGSEHKSVLKKKTAQKSKRQDIVPDTAVCEKRLKRRERRRLRRANNKVCLAMGW